MHKLHNSPTPRYIQVLAGQREPAVVHAMDGTILFANKAFVSSFPGVPEECRGADLYSLIGTHARKVDEVALDPKNATGISEEEYHHQGRIYYYHATKILLENDIIALVGAWHHTTDIRNAEIHALIDSSRAGDSAWVLDMCFRVIICLTDEDSLAASHPPGFCVQDLLDEPSVHRLYYQGHQAQQEPRTWHNFTLQGKRKGGFEPVFVKLRYVPDHLHGGKYEAITRTQQRGVEQIFDRMRQAYTQLTGADVPNLHVLADTMRHAPSKYTRAKTAKTPPLDLIYQCHIETGFSIEWLLYGVGCKHTPTHRRLQECAAID